MLLGTSQAARRLGISAPMVAKLALAGKLPYTQTIYGRCYLDTDVDKLAAERAASPHKKRGPKPRKLATA